MYTPGHTNTKHTTSCLAGSFFGKVTVNNTNKITRALTTRPVWRPPSSGRRPLATSSSRRRSAGRNTTPSWSSYSRVCLALWPILLLELLQKRKKSTEWTKDYHSAVRRRARPGQHVGTRREAVARACWRGCWRFVPSSGRPPVPAVVRGSGRILHMTGGRDKKIAWSLHIPKSAL